jgi:hypothetical protein
MSFVWASDWRDQVSVDMFNAATDESISAYNMFARKILQRCYAVGSTFAPLAATVKPDGSGGAIIVSPIDGSDDTSIQYPLTLSYGATYQTQCWAKLQALVVLMAPYFARTKNADGSAFVIEGASFLPSLTADDSGPILFPPTTGWYRSWSRKIWKLDTTGTIGQRARFTARLGTAFWAHPATDPLFGETATTPDDQQHLSGVTMEYVAHTDGAGHAAMSGDPGWAVSEDQYSGVDYLHEDLADYQNAGGTGLAPSTALTLASFCWTDDLPDGVWLNRLRDAVDMMTRTVGGGVVVGIAQLASATLTTFCVVAVDAVSGVQTIGIADDGQNATGHADAGFGPFTAADAQADYASGIGHPSIAHPGSPGGMGKSVLHNTQLGEAWDIIVASSRRGNFGAIPQSPVSALSRTVSFWVWAQAVNDAPQDLVGPPINKFDAFGDGVLYHQWHQIPGASTTTLTDDGSVFSPAFPTDFSDPSAGGFVPLPPGGGAGWSIGSSLMIVDWDVTGGFD